MAPTNGFIAYPAQPSLIAETIEAGVSRYAKRLGYGRFESWAESDIPGRFIADTVLEKIASSRSLMADISVPNFNVTYEIGYAIGISRRVIAVLNISVSRDEAEFRKVGIFDTFGYKTYQDSQSFDKMLENITDFEPLQTNVAINVSAPVWILQLPFNTEAQGRLLARVKKARLRYRGYDPSEQSRLAASEAIRGIAASHGIIIQLAPNQMTDSNVHNLRAAFCSGLAHGMGKTTIILQGSEDPVPIDYRDFVSHFRHPEQIDEYIAEFAGSVTESLQSKIRVNPPKKGLLAALDMGSSTAENEFASLGQYYLQTDEFQRALRGEARLVVGRKGSGKTAVFAQVRDHIRSNRARVVVDLKPEGYQLRKFKEQIIDHLEEGTAEHTITAFWEYLLLLEVCYKLLEKDKTVHLRDHTLYEPYQQLANIYHADDFISEGDFSERMLKIVDRITELFTKEHSGAQNVRLPKAAITKLLYLHDLSVLRLSVEDYLLRKADLWILFDNLDKGWATHGVGPEDLLIVRCLLDASRKIEQYLNGRGVRCRTITFIRNDVYHLLIDSTPDRGKEIRVSLDWNEPDLLRQMLRRRFIYNGMSKEESFEMCWGSICAPLVDGEESSDFIIQRSLMRPRFLLNLLNHCRAFAVNFGHDRIEEDDFKKGMSTFSTDLIYDLDLEIRDVLPFAEDILYAFLGEHSRLSEDRVKDILRSSTMSNDDMERLFDVLLWYGVLGICRPEGDIAYIYSVNYDMKRLRALLGSLPPDVRALGINPAFWPGLEIKL